MGGINSPSLESDIPVGSLLLLDASALIAYMNRTERVSRAAVTLIDDFVRSGRNPAVVSTVTVMELLVRPRVAGLEAFRTVFEFITHFPNLTVAEFDVAAAEAVSALRAFHGLKPPDAMTVGTGLARGAQVFVTNDARWPKLSTVAGLGINVVYLESYA